ncbi:MAG: ABC transporter substrate-binding protein, partial [Hyphomicrobium sp.]|nr:ABC transporter substrate-binding protein [Hyphomicrobium sp.]
MQQTLIAVLCLTMLLFSSPIRAEPVHGIALYGAPKELPGFTHFSYVNPRAPKGGRLVLGAFGSFDSLNPLIIKGVAANGMRD